MRTLLLLLACASILSAQPSVEARIKYNELRLKAGELAGNLPAATATLPANDLQNSIKELTRTILRSDEVSRDALREIASQAEWVRMILADPSPPENGVDGVLLNARREAELIHKVGEKAYVVLGEIDKNLKPPPSLDMDQASRRDIERWLVKIEEWSASARNVLPALADMQREAGALESD